jgi:hypothetical protein
MEGQGIWYLPPDIDRDLVSANLKHRVAATRTFTRADFGLLEGWFLYVLPQSVFKIHPLYDEVLRDILQVRVVAHHILCMSVSNRTPASTTRTVVFTLFSVACLLLSVSVCSGRITTRTWW